ncbi:IS5 family transposase [Streptomyces sp. NBC_01005]|nr:IS5 family transposase [Streptomyces sp. NBC_01005]WTC92649.1 IS5 family transposase [Streptomyces sp. NBC_01650]
MAVDLERDLVPDGLWEIAAPLIPAFRPRRQGGGTAPVADRKVFTAIVYALTTSCAWRRLPPCFGVSPATAHRRFAAWTRAGLWRRLHIEVLDRLGAAGAIDWSAALVDSASGPSEKGGQLTGPNPVDRGKPGAKLHVLTDAQGLPLVTAVSAANTHDSLALKPLVKAIHAVRSRRGPRRRKPTKLRADKGYDYPELRCWLRNRSITPKIARRGIESSERLGRYRWKVERSISWLFNYRRLNVRYERKSRHFAAFLSLAATLICYKRLARLTT